MQIVVQGKRVTTSVNGKTLVDGSGLPGRRWPGGRFWS